MISRISILSVATLVTSLAFFTAATFAADVAPPCMGAKGAIEINDAQVLAWKTSTPNEYKDRGHVSGTVGRVYPDQTGHHHFQLQIGAGSTDTVEIIFNEGFGATPTIRSGMTVEACGDFINEFAPANGYQPSPDGALVHWVHRSNNLKTHPDGYLVIDGVLYGMGKGQ